MRRGSKPAKAKGQAKLPDTGKSRRDERSRVRDLEKRLAEAQKREAEALEQQAATSEILGVISNSPTDVQPVFKTILGKASSLCDATLAALFLYDGEFLSVAAHQNASPQMVEHFARLRARPDRETAARLAALERTTVHIPDILNDPRFAAATFPLYQREGARTILAVPMLRETALVGVILMWRHKPRPFTDKQIGLVKTFADQAVIAIENVRLFTELQEKNRALTQAHAQVTEALEQQTATSEILRVIASSPTDIQPVLDAVAESAARLCGADDALIHRVEGETMRLVAHFGTLPYLSESATRPIVAGSHSGRAILERRVVHDHDALDERSSQEYPAIHALARMTGTRTVLATPLLREGTPIGVIVIRRLYVRPFSDSQMELVKTFAAQAVIAIENVRLFSELQEKNRALTEAHTQVTQALDQQTATSEILQVISSSPTDVQPVFKAIVRSASMLCDSQWAIVVRFDGEFLHLAAHHNPRPGVGEAVERLFPRRPDRSLSTARAVLERAMVHIPDTDQDPDFDRDAARAQLARSMLAVPLMQHGNAIGAIGVSRDVPGPFSEKQIALLKTFADQAVIAIENVRLFTELQSSNRELTTALEQQTATAEILRVISQSPTDLQPVFDSLLDSAVRLCGATHASLYRVDAELLHHVAAQGSTQGPLALGVGSPIPRGTAPGQAVLTGESVHVLDAQRDIEDMPLIAREFVIREGVRTVLAVPLLREGTSIGVIVIRRTEVRPFAESEIRLLKTFADQAVIAIENVRLFTELQERNREVTATAEVLRVISSSPTDVEPVFDSIVRSAAGVCEAADATLSVVEGREYRIGAHYGPIPLRPVGTRFPIGPGTVMGRSLLEARVLHVEDLSTAEDFPEGRALALELGQRTTLCVPLLREGTTIGAIMLRRSEARRFSDKQVTLLQTFADQAVIAIENVRLFKELQASNRELTEALDRQTATSEILRVISGSRTDLQPVFDTILQSALRLCGALNGFIWRVEDGLRRQVSYAGVMSPEWKAIAQGTQGGPPTQESVSGWVQIEREVLHVPDLEREERFSRSREMARAMGYRSLLAVPMLKGQDSVGAIVIHKAEPFDDGQIQLLRTFADQAVIAIENARLLGELQARTGELTRSVEELTALGDVSRALSSTLELETVLDTIVARASQLAGADGCSIYEYDEAAEVFRLRASSYADPRETETLDPIGRTTPIPRGQGVVSRAAALRQPVQIRDIAVEGAYESPILKPLLQAGYRAVLTVPLLLEEHVIGALGVSRKTPGEFAPEIVRLLTTFAIQSALAIQNARLFREIADKSRQLEVASQHKSEFLANMSHELRTPLNAIIGFSEVLAEGMFGEVNEKQTEYLRDILESGQHLLSLINDILDLSKIEAGRMELELTDFDLPQAISNALTLIRERAGRRGITLHQAVDEHLGQIRGDERKIKQVLLNLLSNALKFTPEGGRVEVRATVADGTAEISVRDTGVGIAPEDQEAVFEEFRQVGTAAKKVEGTGLGLALSRKFIELHGGRIWVKSQVGVGSTFTFTIPVQQGK